MGFARSGLLVVYFADSRRCAYAASACYSNVNFRDVENLLPNLPCDGLSRRRQNARPKMHLRSACFTWLAAGDSECG
jgi:hypothetical protein